MNAYLKKYIPMVNFLAEILGKDAEVVLHDLTDLDYSVVAIRNNHISGRTVGAPATNLVLKVMQDGKYKHLNYITNYKGVSAAGKTLKSATYFISDDNHQIVGMLCINIDYEKFAQFRNYLDSFLQFSEEPDGHKTTERFSHSVEDLTLDSIETVIGNAGIPPKRMSQQEKIEIVKTLHDSGVFLLKGAVSQTALRLEVSEATIYRYLSKIKNEA